MFSSFWILGDCCKCQRLDSGETRTQTSICDHGLQSQDEIDEDPEYLMDLNEDLSRRPTTEPCISNGLDQMQNRLNCMYSSIHGLRFDTDALYEFMRALTSEQLNPMIIPPDVLWNILQEVQDDIKTNAWLKLPDDPVKNIWSYYGTTKLTPIVLENYLMLILTVPLIDTSLEMQTGTCLVWFVMLFSTHCY